MASEGSNSTSRLLTASNQIAYAYALVGTGGMITNIFILTVLISDKKFLKQSAFMAGIAFSQLMCSFSIGTSGINRVINWSSYSQRVSTWMCMAKIYPAILPMAFQSAGVMLIFVSVERLSVFAFPNWYRVKWTASTCWLMIAVGYGWVLISFGLGLFSVSRQSQTTAAYCPYQAIFGKGYFAYSNAVSGIGGTVAVILTLIALIKGLRRAKMLPLLSGEAGRYRRQIKLTRSMLTVAACDFCLVVIPNVLYLLSAFDSKIFPMLATGTFSNFTNVTYCLNTMMSLFSYLAFNGGFRMAAAKLVKCKMCCATRVVDIRNAIDARDHIDRRSCEGNVELNEFPGQIRNG